MTPPRTTPEERKNARALGGYTVGDVPFDRFLSDLEDAERELAECYRLSGADPDGNEDWRLAPHAVEEVRRMRQESDELAAENERLRRIIAEAWEAMDPDSPEPRGPETFARRAAEMTKGHIEAWALERNEVNRLRRERDEAEADAKRAWMWADRGVPDCRCVLAFGMKDGKVAHRDCAVPQYERDLAAHEARVKKEPSA